MTPNPPRRPTRSRWSGFRRGAATVEFSLCAPVVFFMFIGMLEVSRFHIVRHSLDQAVYQGARAGIVPGSTTAGVTQAVNDRLALAGVVGATVSVTPGTINEDTEEVTVAVSADYQTNSWTLPKFFENVTVEAEITMAHENVVFD